MVLQSVLAAESAGTWPSGACIVSLLGRLLLVWLELLACDLQAQASTSASGDFCWFMRRNFPEGLFIFYLFF